MGAELVHNGEYSQGIYDGQISISLVNDGEMTAPGVQDGEFTLNPLEGDFDITPVYDGEIGKFMGSGGGSGDPYTGQTVFTPTTSTQIVHTVGKTMGDDITINPIPGNYSDTSDATATAADIRVGKSAYINGGKVNGALVDVTITQDAYGVVTII